MVQACRSSGQTVRTWCAEHQVSEKQYYYWQRLVRQAAAEQLPAQQSGAAFVEVPAAGQNTFRQRNNAEPGGASLVLHCGKFQLDIYPGASVEQLRVVLQVLDNASYASVPFAFSVPRDFTILAKRRRAWLQQPAIRNSSRSLSSVWYTWYPSVTTVPAYSCRNSLG